MVYIKFFLTSGYAQSDTEVYHEYEERPTDGELDILLDEFVQIHAEENQHEHFSWDYDPSEEEIEEYLESCDGEWEEVTKEEFDENS